MFPDWHDELGVPTIGDDVRILHIVTISPTQTPPKSFHVSVQPKSTNGKLSGHAEALGFLLNRVHADTARFVSRHLKASLKKSDLADLRLDLKNILENYRSSLEYIAGYLATHCTPRPSPARIQFPIANINDNEADFSKKIDKWYPGLSSAYPEVVKHLLSIQHFNENPWLLRLADLSNFNKHRSLSSLELRTFHSVAVQFGSAGLRFGELGLKSCRLEGGGVLRFVDQLESQADITAPSIIDATTTSLPHADSRIEIIHEKRTLYGIPNIPESVAGLIWTIGKNTFRTVNNICALLSTPRQGDTTP